MDWDGEKTSDDQAMEWPRTGAYTKSGSEYASDVIPIPVKFATFELAYYLLQNGGLLFESSVIDQVKVGPVSIKFDQKVKELGIPSFVLALIEHIGNSDLTSSNQMHTVELERV
jgi:hypothetical protein